MAMNLLCLTLIRHSTSQTSRARKPKKHFSDGKQILNYLILFRGITFGKNLQLAKYRFNKNFHLIGAEEFLMDIFNDQSVTNSFAPLAGNSECTGVKFSKLTCGVLNMSFFDVFQELKLVTDGGDIRQTFEERWEGIIIQDRIRNALFWEETEDYEAWDRLHEDKYAKEFIFKLFVHLQVGGSVN